MFEYKKKIEELNARIEELEEKISVKKCDRSFLDVVTGGKTIGEVVEELRNSVYNGTTDANRIEVRAEYTCIDEDGDKFTSSKYYKLSEIIPALLDHCGLELHPEKTLPVSVKKKSDA